jgi:hypothetical protein
MPFTVTITKTTAGLDNSYTVPRVYIAGAKQSISETINGSTTNQLVNFNFIPSSGKVLAFSTDANYNVTVKTNNTATPDNTFIITSTSPLLYNAITGSNGSISWGDYDSNGNSLNANIDRLFVTNTGTADIAFNVDALYDPTP